MPPYLYKKTDCSPLWRVFRTDQFLSFLDNGALYFPRPQQWDDPFENVLLKIKYHEACTNIPLTFSGKLDRFFGQCWTRKADESDATWRIYAPHKLGVRIRSSVDKLHNCLKAAVGRLNGALHICRIDYFDAAKIIHQASLLMELGEGLHNAEQLISFLTLKRPEFSHEEEVRLLFEDIHHNIALTDNHVLLDAAPLKIVDEITVDPRISDKDFDAFRNELIARGVTVPINHSELYRLPQMDIPVYRR